MTVVANAGDALRGARAWVVAALILLFPVTTLLIERAATVAMLLLALLGIVYTLTDRRIVAPLSRDEKLLVFAAGFIVAVALLAYFLGDINYLGFKKLGRYLRFLLLIPIYLVVRRLPDGDGVWWSGLVIGSVAAGLFSLVTVSIGEPPLHMSKIFQGLTEPVLFGYLSLAAAFMCLGGLEFYRRQGGWQSLLPVAGFVLGCTAAVLSGVRGAWIAVPGLALLSFWFLARRHSRRARWLLLLTLFLLVLVAWLIPASGLAERFQALVQDFEGLWQGEGASGLFGQRFELWQIALEAFARHPVFGAGVGGFALTLREWVEAGLAPESLLGYDHPHSEYLLVLATRGLVGLLALLLIFGIPFKHFLWGVRHRDRDIAGLSFAGMTLVVGFAHFALTEAIFDRTLPITFYVFSLAVIYGLVRASERRYLSRETRRATTLSVIIIAKNEADRIGDTLASVKGWADEIIVLDSGSTDGTVALARRYTEQVHETDWPGFGKQKQRALERARCDWVLSLDADEIASRELRNEIDHELARPTVVTGFRIPRPLIIFGEHVDYGGSWQAPIRLFRRDAARFDDAPVHEKVELSRGKVGMLRSGLLHPTWRDYAHAMQKFSEYAWLQANVRWERGRRSSMTAAALRGAYNFIYNYFLRFGFLDGAHGFALAVLHAQYTYNKYAALWALAEERRHESHDE